MDKYNWDLTRMYKDEKEFKNAIKEDVRSRGGNCN